MTDAVPALVPAADEPTPIGLSHQMATRAAFLVAGLCVSAWAPLIPFAKSRLSLTDGQLGLLLLCLGIGSVIGMPMAGVLAGRFGCRRMIALSAALACGALPVLAIADRPWLLAAGLLCFGAAVGTMDVVMNVHAVLVERASERPLMSGFHGMYSVGGIAGAGVVSLLISAGASPLIATAAIVVVSVLLIGVSYTSLLPYGGEPGGPTFVLPHGRVVILGCFCFVLFLAEGSVLDWSGVLLTTLRHVGEAHAGLGYVAFSTTMTVCRLTGDAIVRALGPARVVFFGGLCAAAGFLLAVLVPGAATAVVGFGIVGVGASNAVPVMFSAAGRQTVMPANLAIAAITTFGYAGILVGPAMVGFLASVIGLSAGLAVIAAMLMAVAVTSFRVRL